MNRLSPENSVRVEMITKTLMFAGVGHALLGGVLLSENFPEMLVWTVGVPAALWMIWQIIRRDATTSADTNTLGLAIGLTSVGIEALSKTDGLFSTTTFGAMTFLGAIVTAHVGREFIRQFIHPQVPPGE